MQKIEDFTLPNQNDELINLKSMLSKKRVLIIMYRGSF